MDLDRRSIGRGMLALGAAAALARAGRAAPAAGTKTVTVRVEPAPGSALEVDDAQVLAVRNSLSALLQLEPASGAGKVENSLRDSFEAVEEIESAAAYLWYYINGHWVHHIELLTEFVVDFGAGRTVLVRVDELEPKPI
jgi:hypothetical protein